MGTCLVTKIKCIVDNNSLLHVGELVVTLQSTKVNEVIFQSNGCQYSCNKSVVEGSEIIQPNTKRNITTWTDLKSTEIGEYDIHLFDKYSLKALLCKVNAKDFSGISSLINCNEIQIMSPSKNVDFSLLMRSPNLSTIVLSGNISGDISDLKNNKLLSMLNLSGNISGNLYDLKDIQSLTNISINCPKVNITAGSLPMNLKSLNCENSDSNNFGDISVVCPNLTYFFVRTVKGLVWSERPSSYKTISIYGSPALDNVDKMLQDQANCQIGITGSEAGYLKVISATGNRTPVSDNAISTLQSRGYTVSIQPA